MAQPTPYTYFQPPVPVEPANGQKAPALTPMFDTLGIPLAPVPTGRIQFEPPNYGPDVTVVPLAPALENPLLRMPPMGAQASHNAPPPRGKRGQVARPPEDREERQAYEEKKKFAISLIKRLPMDTRKLICVAEYFKHMEQGKLRKPEAFKAAGESAGTSAKSAMNWVEDFTARGDGTFSESKRGKHAKSPWLLQAPHLQARAQQWLKEQTAPERAPPKNASLSRAFQEYCNNELLIDAEVPKPKKRKTDAAEAADEEAPPDATGARRISQKTARAWLHKLGYDSRHKAMAGDVDNELDVTVVAGRLPGVDDGRDPEDLPIVQSNQSLQEQLRS
eukprot:TRINITY_DN15030_c0_g1_i1.p1 TRINITY_DN15030_c0_g1~~TRINITY_DN15030_c0_g1_i1.p1  ORF type:complete len:334 (+),score=70.07 TRINITY_DN15030_c0_g1_i1:100-1101(+)